MAKIYLSSTFADLEGHRRAVYRVLRQLGHDVISMEDYTAGGRPPKEKCLADARRCDVYVGLFAFRYGFVPDGERRSITELEYREAVGANRQVLAFILSEDAAWPANLIDRDRSAIDALRADLEDRHVVQFFVGEDDLATAVSVSVAKALGGEEAPPDPGRQRFYRRVLSRLTHELDNQIRVYRLVCAVLVALGVVGLVAGVVMGLSFVGLGGLLVGAAAVFPVSTMLAHSRQKALLGSYEEELQLDDPAAEALAAVGAFLRNHFGESTA